eukprot:gene25925-31130_t
MGRTVMNGEVHSRKMAMSLLAATTLTAIAAEPAKMVETKAGKVLATDKGMTLYTFDKDAKGKSNCDADCLKKWPAFHPLYTFAKDTKEGETGGDGVGSVWHVVKQ